MSGQALFSWCCIGIVWFWFIRIFSLLVAGPLFAVFGYVFMLVFYHFTLAPSFMGLLFGSLSGAVPLFVVICGRRFVDVVLRYCGNV